MKTVKTELDDGDRLFGSARLFVHISQISESHPSLSTTYITITRNDETRDTNADTCPSGLSFYSE